MNCKDVQEQFLDLANGPLPAPRANQVAQHVAACSACGKHDFVHLNATTRTPVSLCGRNAVQLHELVRPMDLPDLAGRLAPLGAVRYNDFALRFETPPYELTVFPDGRVIVKGTQDIGVARSVYARYIGI